MYVQLNHLAVHLKQHCKSTTFQYKVNKQIRRIAKPVFEPTCVKRIPVNKQPLFCGFSEVSIVCKPVLNNCGSQGPPPRVAALVFLRGRLFHYDLLGVPDNCSSVFCFFCRRFRIMKITCTVLKYQATVWDSSASQEPF